MSAGLNRVQLLGNLGQDPELRHTRAGTPVLGLRLATSERRKGEDGEWTDHTEWHSAVIFGKRAEALSRLLRKGERVYLEGPIRHRTYEGRDGIERQSVEVHASEVVLLGRGGGANGGRGRATAEGSTALGAPDDDIPF